MANFASIGKLFQSFAPLCLKLFLRKSLFGFGRAKSVLLFLKLKFADGSLTLLTSYFKLGAVRLFKILYINIDLFRLRLSANVSHPRESSSSAELIS